MINAVSKEKQSARSFTKKDREYVCETILQMWKTRKENRKDLEKQWKEIDRQLLMEPDLSHKLDATGKPDRFKAWMPEVELPLQAQTLEVLSSDVRRMMFTDSGSWFTPHAHMTDEYLATVDFQSLISGDEMEVPSLITQDNADKMIIGLHEYWHNQYDFTGHYDLINAEALKYGMGIGRGRMVTKKTVMHTAKGVVPKNQAIPIIFPRSIKNIYLEDNPHNLMNEGVIIGSSVLAYKEQSWIDLMMAAKQGSSDPHNENGGWMPKHVTNITKDKLGNVKLLELEGDMVIPRETTDSLHLPNVLITIAIGDKEKSRDIVRLRFRNEIESSYIEHPYHLEHIDNPYPTSPLIKGMPIQKAAVEILVRLMMVSALHSLPPISRSPDDMYFNEKGTIPVFPGAQWLTNGDVKMHQIGDPAALFAIYSGLLAQYADVTGVNAPRLGAQTVSHTTAYAKEAELSRGTIRTVDYVQSTLPNGLTRWLEMSYNMGAHKLTETSIFIRDYGGYINISKRVLPKGVTYEVQGSGGPNEQQAKQQAKMAGIQLASSLEQLKAQAIAYQIPTKLDFDKLIEMALRESGITDLDSVTKTDAPVDNNIASDSAFAPGQALQGLTQ